MKPTVVSLSILGLLFASKVQAGGEFSRAAAGVGLGIVTGMAGVVLGATIEAAATTGVAAAIGVAANQRTNVGLAFDENEQSQGVYADVTTNDGVQVARVRAGQGFESPPPPLPTPSFQIPSADSAQLRREYEQAKLVLHVDNESGYNWGMVHVGYSDYYWQKNNNSEFLSLNNGRRWTTSAYHGFDALSTFPWTNEDERLAMKSYVFELTPYDWKFSRMFLGGRWYNRAYTNTGLDIMVPEGEIHYICAPKSYTERRKRQQYGNIPLVVERDVVDEYFTESRWAIYSAYQNAQRINFLDPMQSAVFESQGRLNADAALSYYEKALDEALKIGSAAFNWTVAFAIPGGWQNLQKFARGTQTAWQFAQNVIADVGPDLVAAGVGGFGGFYSRVAKTTVRVARMYRQQQPRVGNNSYMSGGGERGAKPRAGTKGYKSGDFWGSLSDVNTPVAQRQIGKINKQAFGGGEMRTDGEYVYRFDNGHKTGKVHIERYRKLGSNKWQGYGEIDPTTGTKIEGSLARTGGRIITW